MQFEETIKCFEATSGMTLSKDFILDGKVFLAKNSKITESLCERIQNICPLADINIFYDETIAMILEDTAVSKTEKSEKLFNALTKGAENLFEKTSMTNSIEIMEVRRLCNTLITELKESGIAIKTILSQKQVEEYIYRHSVNVSALSALLAKWLGLPNRDILHASYAGMLHDVGKLYVNPSLINKKGFLSTTEKVQIEKHVKFGYKLTRKIPFLDSSISSAVLLHHERENGSGYPLKLKGDKIPTIAKIVAVTDIFDTITSTELYGKKQYILDALELINDKMFSSLFPDISSVFLSHIINYYIGENFNLSNGKIGKVINIDSKNISKPLILVEDNLIDLNKDSSIKVLDLI